MFRDELEELAEKEGKKKNMELLIEYQDILSKKKKKRKKAKPDVKKRKEVKPERKKGIKDEEEQEEEEDEEERKKTVSQVLEEKKERKIQKKQEKPQTIEEIKDKIREEVSKAVDEALINPDIRLKARNAVDKELLKKKYTVGIGVSDKKRDQMFKDELEELAEKEGKKKNMELLIEYEDILSKKLKEKKKNKIQKRKGKKRKRKRKKNKTRKEASKAEKKAEKANDKDKDKKPAKPRMKERLSNKQFIKHFNQLLKSKKYHVLLRMKKLRKVLPTDAPLRKTTHPDEGEDDGKHDEETHDHDDDEHKDDEEEDERYKQGRNRDLFERRARDTEAQEKEVKSVNVRQAPVFLPLQTDTPKKQAAIEMPAGGDTAATKTAAPAPASPAAAVPAATPAANPQSGSGAVTALSGAGTGAGAIPAAFSTLPNASAVLHEPKCSKEFWMLPCKAGENLAFHLPGVSTLNQCMASCHNSPRCKGFDWQPSAQKCWLMKNVGKNKPQPLNTAAMTQYESCPNVRTHFEAVYRCNCTYQYMVDPCKGGPAGTVEREADTLQDCMSRCQINPNCRGLDFTPNSKTCSLASVAATGLDLQSVSQLSISRVFNECASQTSHFELTRDCGDNDDESEVVINR